MSLDAAILGFLAQRARSGYDLKTRCFDGAVRDLWTADQAQIYRTLDRLQTARLVEATRKRQTGRPDRKVYSLTALGHETLAAWGGSNLALPAPRDAFLLQLYFAAQSSDTELAQRLASRRQLHQTRLERLRTSATAAQDNASSARQAHLQDAALGGAMAVERAIIDWLDDRIEEASAGTLPAADQLDSRDHLLGSSPA